MTYDAERCDAPEDYISFLVRLWGEHPGNDQPGDWQDELEQIQASTRWRFSTHSELPPAPPR